MLNTHRPLFLTCGSARPSTTRSTAARSPGSVRMGSDPSNRPISTCRSAMPGFKDAHIYPLTPRPGRLRDGSPADVGEPPSSTPSTSLPVTGWRRSSRRTWPRSGSTSWSRPSASMLCSTGSAGRGSLSTSRWGNSSPGAPTTRIPETSSISWSARVREDWSRRSRSRLPAQARAAARLAGPRSVPHVREARCGSRPGTTRPGFRFGNLVSHDFFSARMGCQVYNPFYGWTSPPLHQALTVLAGSREIQLSRLPAALSGGFAYLGLPHS